MAFTSLPKGSKAQKRLGPQDRVISKDSSCPAILGFRVSISRGPYHEHNYEIKFAERIACFFPMRKYIQAMAALPISQASHRIHSNNTGKVSKIQSSPCFSSFLPPNRCCRPGEEAHRACDSHAIDGVSRWRQILLGPQPHCSFQPEAAPHRVQKVGSSFKGVEETATFQPGLQAQR